MVSLIKNSHYLPAFEKGMKEHINQINEIIKQEEKPNFENTIIKLEKSGELLNRVSYVFYSMSWANTNDSLESIRTEIAPQLSAHNDEILLKDLDPISFSIIILAFSLPKAGNLS